MSDLTNYQLLLAIALTLALVFVVHDAALGLIRVMRERDALKVENAELKDRVARLSIDRAAIYEECYERIVTSQSNSAAIRRIAIRQLLDAEWDDSPKGVHIMLDKWAREKRKADR